jgi:protease IV
MSERKITFGRIFWPTFWAAILVSLLGALIWFIVISVFVSGFTPEPYSLNNKSILHMKLDNGVNERGETKLDPSTFTIDNKLSLAAVLHGLDVAAKDKKIKGVFVEIDNLDCGMATAREIRNAINAFEKSGKFVVAYHSGEAITTKEYYLASAADESYGFPSSNIQFLGLGAELGYFKGTLDKLDVEVQIVRGSDNHFKSAVEPFFLTEMSDSARLQNERYMSSMWLDMRKDIAKDRKVSIEKLDELAENATILDVRDAVKHKLINAAKYRDEVLEILAKKAGVENSEELELVDFNKFAKKKFYQDQVLAQSDKPNVAVILAEGGVATSGDGLTSEEICRLFREVRNDKNIKTVVFRVNSPGGSALASDEIWREVKLTNEKKKVIVSMGDLAASGGYYVAAPADYIFADPMTITGSIGVFGMIPYTGKMFENKLGMTFDRVATNKHSVLTTNRKLTEDEFSVIQRSVDDIYEQFKSRVAEGRSMTTKEVNVVGRGRVWTGSDALRIGLVDELGGMKDAINYAAKQAGVKKTKVIYYPKVKEDKWSEILEQLEDSEDLEVKMKKMALPQELVLHYEQLRKIEQMQGVQMRMPFEPVFN